MLVRVLLVSVAVVALVLVATIEMLHVDASGGVIGQNDANTGADAADAVGIATLLTGTGPFSGMLAGTDDSDWFEFSGTAAGPGCLSLAAAGPSELTAALGPASGAPQLSTAMHAAERTLGYAVGEVDDALAHIYRPVGSVGTADYTFGTGTSLVGSFTGGDGGSGGDAGPTGSSGVEAPGACFGGVLGATPGDTLDTYTFDVAQGDSIVISIAQGASDPAVVAEVRDASGGLRGTADGDAVVAATATAAGTWTITVVADAPGGSQPVDILGITLNDSGASSLGAGTSYAIGLCVPYCVVGS